MAAALSGTLDLGLRVRSCSLGKRWIASVSLGSTWPCVAHGTRGHCSASSRRRVLGCSRVCSNCRVFARRCERPAPLQRLDTTQCRPGLGLRCLPCQISLVALWPSLPQSLDRAGGYLEVCLGRNEAMAHDILELGARFSGVYRFEDPLGMMAMAPNCGGNLPEGTVWCMALLCCSMPSFCEGGL